MIQLDPSSWPKDQRVGSDTVGFADTHGYSLGFFFILSLDTEPLLLCSSKIAFTCNVEKGPFLKTPQTKSPSLYLET